MKSVRTRVGAVVVVLASVTVGLVVTQGTQAGAAQLQYQCIGVNTDNQPSNMAARVGGLFGTYTNYSTQGFLNYIKGLVGSLGTVTTEPVLDATVATTDVDGTQHLQGSTVTRNFLTSVSLPADLVSDATHYLGLSQVYLRNSTFSVNGAGTTPSSITSSIAAQDVPLSAGYTITAPTSGNFGMTGPAGSFATYTPGSAHVELQVNPTSPTTGVHITHVVVATVSGNVTINTDFYINSLRFNCSPLGSAPNVGFDQITGASTTTTQPASTTTTQPATTTTTTQPATTTTTTQPATTTTTTQPATTTTTQPATTTTTEPATTTTTQPDTTTTTQPATTTTTTQPATTTTTQPASTTTTTTIPGTHSISVTVAGAGYTNSGPVTSGSYTVTPGTVVAGSGTLAGTHGGSATVSISIQKFLVWGFGTVTVTDPGAGLAPVTGYVLFGAAPSKTSTAYGFSFVGGVFRSYTITVTIN